MKGTSGCLIPILNTMRTNVAAPLEPLSKRERAALWSSRLGLTVLLETVPKRPLLLVLNYHRIGNPETTPYDPGLFSATGDEFDAQLTSIGRRFDILTLNEAVDFVYGKTKLRRPSVLITFDDGYLDNYTLAFPILRSHGIQGVFFLPTYFVASANLPWWDVIAFIVRSCRKSDLILDYPERATFNLNNEDRRSVIRRVLLLCKKPTTTDHELFIARLEQACEVSRPGTTSDRCFLDWAEAQQMQRQGMAFGSHTHSHTILSKLPVEQQRDELVKSRQILESRLQGPIDVLAYPVGARDTFSDATISALRESGYRAAFSFYGGFNLPGKTKRFDTSRVGVSGQSLARLRLQMAIGALDRHTWL